MKKAAKLLAAAMDRVLEIRALPLASVLDGPVGTRSWPAAGGMGERLAPANGLGILTLLGEADRGRAVATIVPAADDGSERLRAGQASPLAWRRAGLSPAAPQAVRDEGQTHHQP